MKTNKMIRVLFLLKHCKDRGKYDLALKIIDKYKINKETLEEKHYD